jgi:hypothetical protein
VSFREVAGAGATGANSEAIRRRRPTALPGARPRFDVEPESDDDEAEAEAEAEARVSFREVAGAGASGANSEAIRKRRPTALPGARPRFDVEPESDDDDEAEADPRVSFHEVAGAGASGANSEAIRRRRPTAFPSDSPRAPRGQVSRSLQGGGKGAPRPPRATPLAAAAAAAAAAGGGKKAPFRVMNFQPPEIPDAARQFAPVQGLSRSARFLRVLALVVLVYCFFTFAYPEMYARVKKVVDKPTMSNPHVGRKPR